MDKQRLPDTVDEAATGCRSRVQRRQQTSERGRTDSDAASDAHFSWASWNSSKNEMLVTGSQI